MDQMQFRTEDGLFPKNNNLEWMRLIFAFQVAISHASTHLDANLKLPAFISNFPGVPAFFFVSGFLIYASYNNSQGKNFFLNRVLRLIPGLVFVTIGGGAVIIYAKGLESLIENSSVYFVWFLSQVTLGQAYNPAYFRDVGIGVINGSLWTVTVEIFFYLTIPLIVYFEKRQKFSTLVIGIFSYLSYLIAPIVLNQIVYKNKSIYDILALTPVIWGWMFCLGIFAAKYFWLFQKWIKYFPIILIPLILILITYGSGPLFEPTGNRLGIIYFICYAGLILWATFYFRYIRLPFDFSYGIYIWHGPVINLLIFLMMPNIYLGIILTLLMAAISWLFVEKPMLRLKKRSIHPV